MNPIKNKVYLTIKADHNDADYMEKVTEIDIDETVTFEIFQNFFNVMRKLVADSSVNGWHHIDWYFNRLNEEDISHLMKFESANYEVPQDYYKQFEIEEFSLLDMIRNHDSMIIQMFPYFENWYDIEQSDRIRGHHTLESIKAIYIDSNCQAFEL